MRKLLFLLLCALCLPTYAERWYDVELIVFKHNVSPENTMEFWPKTAQEVDMANVINVSDFSNLARYNIEPLAKSKFQLTDHYNKLSRSGKYKNLLHVGWTQNDSGRSGKPKIGLPVGKIASDKPELNGYIRLYVDHYFFFETNLLLHQSVSELVEDKFDPRVNNIEGQTSYQTYIKPFNFKQKRRMKSDEIHYIDHPLLGIILQIRKLGFD